MVETAKAADKLNVFISYSRDDLEFADQLDASLQLGGFETTIDRRGMSGGEDWKARLGALIRDADTVVFALSPSSARSDICVWEVAEAVQLGKRIIPVLCRPLGDAEPPQQLADRDYIYFYPEPKFPGSGFGPGLLRLAAALNTDPSWLREHTRYLRLAKEWEEVGKPENRRLLSAADIALAKEWAKTRPAKAPELTALQREFLSASEEEDIRQGKAKAAAEVERREAAERTAAEAKKAADARKRTTQVALAGLVAALLVAAAAIWQYFDATAAKREALVDLDRAVRAEDAANKAKEQANASLRQAQTTQSLFLADEARVWRERGDAGDGVLLALESLPDAAAGVDRPYVSEAKLQLDGARHALKERVVLGHQGTVYSAAFSPDGQRIVTASADKTARIWDAASGQPIGEPLKGHEDVVTSAAFSPDGLRIVTASGDKTARIWDAASGQPIGEPLTGHEAPVHSAAFSPDGLSIVTASGDKTARIWDAASGQPIGEPLKGHQGSVYHAAFSPDGLRIVTASGDGTARMWDVATGKPIGEPLKGHRGAVYSAAFSPDGQRIVTASADKTARIWDVATGKPIGEPLAGLQGAVYSAVFSPDGLRIVTASADAWVVIWDAASGKPIGEPLEGHQTTVFTAAFSPDGLRVLTASSDRTARIWDDAAGVLKGHENEVSRAAFSPDGQRIVTASGDKTARIWDVATGKPIGAPLTGHRGPVLSAVFSPDGQKSSLRPRTRRRDSSPAAATSRMRSGVASRYQ